MFEYRDARGAIAIDFERGCVKYLESGGKILTAQTELPLFALRLRMPSCEAAHFDAFQGKLTALSEKESGAVCTVFKSPMIFTLNSTSQVRTYSMASGWRLKWISTF